MGLKTDIEHLSVEVASPGSGSVPLVGEERDRVGDERVDLTGLDPAGRDERGDALHGGHQEQAETFGIARREYADLLSLVDQVAERGQRSRRCGGQLRLNRGDRNVTTTWHGGEHDRRRARWMP
jgi:hypothetical protein